MKNGSKQWLEDNIRTVKLLADRLDGDSLGNTLGRIKAVYMMDILVILTDDKGVAREYNTYKSSKGLADYGIHLSGQVSQDSIYGIIKELEFFLDTIKHLGLGEDVTVLDSGITRLMETFSKVFTDWEEVSVLFSSEETVLDESLVVEEFSYEELVGRGGEPKYRLEEKDSAEPVRKKDVGKAEEAKLLSRVERRRKRRSS